jgi:hypothetical protein
MSDFEPVNHADAAEENLPRERRRDRMLSLIRGLMAGLQTIEDDALFVIEDTTITFATGDALLQYARLFGVPSAGIGEADLRRLILAKILAARCSGNIDSILEVLSVAAGAREVRHYDVPPLRSYLMAVVDVPAPDVIRRRIGAIIASVKPGGVALTLVEAPFGYFGFAEDPDALGFDVGIFAKEYK